MREGAARGPTRGVVLVSLFVAGVAVAACSSSTRSVDPPATTAPPQTDTSAARPAAAGAPESTTEVVMLGTGTPNPDPNRSGPAVAVVAGGQPYLVDCGPGVVRRAAAAGLEMPTLTRLFITHLHSDHTAGFADLILTPWVLERHDPLVVYGPPGINEMTDHLLAEIREGFDGEVVFADDLDVY